MGNHKRIATGMTVIPLHTGYRQESHLNATELAVCSEMRLSPDEYREANPTEAKGTNHGSAEESLSHIELAVCREMGLSPDEYREANPIETAGAEQKAAGQTLSDAELAVCRGMGLSAQAYQDANPEDSPQELEALISEGLRDGRIAGAETARWLRQQGVAACRSHLSKVPGTEALRHGLNDAELAVCRRMGLSPEAYHRANADDE